MHVYLSELFMISNKPLVLGLRFEKFCDAILHAGLIQSENDHAVLVYTSYHSRTILLYVDDMIITSNDSTHIQSIKSHL